MAGEEGDVGEEGVAGEEGDAGEDGDWGGRGGRVGRRGRRGRNGRGGRGTGGMHKTRAGNVKNAAITGIIRKLKFIVEVASVTANMKRGQLT